MSDSLWPHELQHTRLPCPILSPRVCSNSCPLSWWCHPVISSSVIPSSSCPQSFPASVPFPMSQLFASGGQRIGASASVLPINPQDWSPLGWTGWISLQSKGFSRVFSNTTVQKHQFLGAEFLPRSKHLLISWLQSPSAVILEPKKIKSVSVYVVSPSICHEVMGPVFIYSASLLISLMYFQISIHFFFNE